jgi:hypothetical protein
MAQSRPTTTTDGAKALAKTITTSRSASARSSSARTRPAAAAAVVDPARGAIDHNAGGGWTAQASAPTRRHRRPASIEQSGGFTLVDSTTLALPLGLYVWSGRSSSGSRSPTLLGGYFGTRLGALAQGGPLAIANTVRNYTSYDEQMILCRSSS